MLKNWTKREATAAEAAISMELFFIINRKDCTLNKKRNLRKYSVVFVLKHFLKKKNYLTDHVTRFPYSAVSCHRVIEGLTVLEYFLNCCWRFFFFFLA